MKSYIEQYERVKRYYQRFEELDEGKPHDKKTEYYIDDIYAFFINCYHLKDWILHDVNLPSTKRDSVEDYITNSKPLSLSADICNAKKHMVLDYSRSGKFPETGPKGFSLTLGSAHPTIKVKMSVVLSDQTTLDAFGLATNCVKEWERFLSDLQS